MSAETDRIRLTIRGHAGTLVQVDQNELERLAKELLSAGLLSSRGYRLVMRHKHWYWRAWRWLTIWSYAALRKHMTTED